MQNIWHQSNRKLVHIYLSRDGKVLENRPDIIIKRKKDKICLLRNVALLSDRNVKQKESEKKLKYKNIFIEIKRMWNKKCFVIPEMTGTIETVSKGLKKFGNYQEIIQHILYKQQP
jgi:hypothetical protein